MADRLTFLCREMAGRIEETLATDAEYTARFREITGLAAEASTVEPWPPIDVVENPHGHFIHLRLPESQDGFAFAVDHRGNGGTPREWERAVQILNRWVRWLESSECTPRQPQQQQQKASGSRAHDPPGYLGLIVDHEHRIVTREGHQGKSVDLSRRPALWAAFVALLKAKGNPGRINWSSYDDEFETSGRRTTIGALRSELTGLGITVADRRYALVENVSGN